MLREAVTEKVVVLPTRATDQLEEVLARVRPEQITAMEAQIDEWADNTGNDRTNFFASNWQTGTDWKVCAGGVFEPLYQACDVYQQNPVEYAGWMYGWLVRRCMIRRPDQWLMYKNPEAGSGDLPRNMWGTFYWREHRT
jgi:hypothetical protein